MTESSVWPLLLCMIVPFSYWIKFQRDKQHFLKLLAILGVLIVCVLLSDYFIVNATNDFESFMDRILSYSLLPFVLILIIFKGIFKDSSFLEFKKFSLGRQGVVKTTRLFLYCIPIIIVLDVLIYLIMLQNLNNSRMGSTDFWNGGIYFFDAFNEEFLFRGILFMVLLSLTSLRAAWVTSIAGFALAHTRYYLAEPSLIHYLPMLSVIVVAIITVEIARRSENIIGSWLIHGSSNFISVTFLPVILGPM